VEVEMSRTLLSALVTISLAAPAAAAAATLTVEGFYGLARPPEANLRAAVVGAQDERDLADSSLQLAGGDVLVNLGGFQLGAIVDTTFGDGVTQTAVGGLLGFRLGDDLRLDLLGEVGGHRFGNVLDDPSIVTASSTSEWLMYVGVRPGIAYRVDVAPTIGLIVGVWGFARWDVTDKSIALDVGQAGSTSPADLDLGGTTIGATFRLGVEVL
jgi:hypothetical protein